MGVLGTRLQNLRVASPQLDKWTARPSRYGAFDVVIGGNDEADAIVSQELLARASTAVGRDVEIPVYDAQDVTLGNARSVTIADSDNNSTLYTVTFETITWGWTQVASEFMNNELGQQQDWNRSFLKYLYKVGAKLDDISLAAMNLNKSQVYNDLLGLYTNAGNVVVAPNALKDEIIGDMTSIAEANDYYGGYHIIGNPGMKSRAMKMSEHALFNDQDKTIQFADKNFHFTNRLANDVGHAATAYMVNTGSLGMVFRNERESILGTKLPTHEWGIDRLPLLGVPVDTYYYYGVGDESGRGAHMADAKRVVKHHYGFALEVATVVAHMNDLANNPAPVMKFAISAT